MTSKETFFELCLSFPGVEQKPHFERTAFKVRGKRIFASYLESEHSANLFLPVLDQITFSEFEGGNIYPVPNKWGDQGWTTFELNTVPEKLVLDALNTAYNHVTKPGIK